MVLLGRGDGSFQPPGFFDIAGTDFYAAQNLSVGDFNGDGNVDVVVGNGNVVLGNGDGTFGSASLLPIPAGYAAGFTAVGDFNKDGKLDVITGNNLMLLP